MDVGNGSADAVYAVHTTVWRRWNPLFRGNTWSALHFVLRSIHNLMFRFGFIHYNPINTEPSGSLCFPQNVVRRKCVDGRPEGEIECDERAISALSIAAKEHNESAHPI